MVEKVDMVTLNVIDNQLISICREMGHVLMRTSYSSIFNEGLDFTCALATPQGDMIAVAEFCPAQIGAMPVTIEACLAEIPYETLHPGDVIIHNDPYRGGCHIPEHTVRCH
jgi:5-oxoprolinase (ATP-hydrolysing)/N-methylhydantoinase B